MEYSWNMEQLFVYLLIQSTCIEKPILLIDSKIFITRSSHCSFIFNLTFVHW